MAFPGELYEGKQSHWSIHTDEVGTGHEGAPPMPATAPPRHFAVRPFPSGGQSPWYANHRESPVFPRVPAMAVPEGLRQGKPSHGSFLTDEGSTGRKGAPPCWQLAPRHLCGTAMKPNAFTEWWEIPIEIIPRKFARAMAFPEGLQQGEGM